MAKPIVIIGSLLVGVDIFLLIRCGCKFQSFARRHKQLKNMKRWLQQNNYNKMSSRTGDNLSTSAEEVLNFSSNNSFPPKDKMSMMSSQVSYDVSTDKVKVFSFNRRFSTKTGKDENTSYESDVTNCVKCNGVRSKQISYMKSYCKIASFSNSFLLARLKRNLVFLSAVVLLLCMGVASIAVMTYASCGNSDPGYHKVLMAITPAIICPGLNSLLLCFTNSDLQLAILSAIQRLFYICRTVHYVNK